MIDEVGVTAGKMVLSPTRTYAPIIKDVLSNYRPVIHGLVHCSGGAQTKVMHFVDNLHIVKDNLFEIPPLFKIIQKESGTSWQEMYKVFNMGHRMEIFTSPDNANRVIDIAAGFNLDAKIVDHL